MPCHHNPQHPRSFLRSPHPKPGAPGHPRPQDRPGQEEHHHRHLRPGGRHAQRQAHNNDHQQGEIKPAPVSARHQQPRVSGRPHGQPHLQVVSDGALGERLAHQFGVLHGQATQPHRPGNPRRQQLGERPVAHPHHESGQHRDHRILPPHALPHPDEGRNPADQPQLHPRQPIEPGHAARRAGGIHPMRLGERPKWEDSFQEQVKGEQADNCQGECPGVRHPRRRRTECVFEGGSEF